MEGAPAAGAQSGCGEGARLPAELYSHSAPGSLQRGAAHFALLKRFPLRKKPVYMIIDFDGTINLLI